LGEYLIINIMGKCTINNLFFGVKMKCFEGENEGEMPGNKGFCVPRRRDWEHRPPGGSKRLDSP
jgi:hypothetical protein